MQSRWFRMHPITILLSLALNYARVMSGPLLMKMCWLRYMNATRLRSKQNCVARFCMDTAERCLDVCLLPIMSSRHSDKQLQNVNRGRISITKCSDVTQHARSEEHT